jgi:hypothetical protein
MFRHAIVTLAVVASCALTARSVSAQISATADIAGFSLSMTKAQAKTLAESKGAKGTTIDLPVMIQANGYRLSGDAGLARELTSPGLNPEPGDNLHHDSIIVLYDPTPNTSDIFAISRRVTYTRGDQMLHSTLLNSLIEKYGRPYAVKTWGVLQDETDYTWVSDPAAYDPRVCGPDTHVYRPYFYEGVMGDLILRNAADEAGSGLVAAISGGAQRIAARAHCGIIFTVSISDMLGTHNEFVYELRETLVDTGRGASDIRAFGDLVAAGANAAHQRQIDEARQNKPSL